MYTWCPFNLKLGTAMRASIDILVPKLIASLGFEKLEEKTS
jgi:hypothetical protein